jgi:hypothetical protein
MGSKSEDLGVGFFLLFIPADDEHGTPTVPVFAFFVSKNTGMRPPSELVN